VEQGAIVSLVTRSETVAVLESPRLVLRRFTLDDAPALLEILADPQVMRWFPHPLSEAEVESWIERRLRQYDEHGHSLFAVELRGAQGLIGYCGVARLEVNGKVEPEVAYGFRPLVWGRGYATEAARASMQHAFREFKLPRVISMIRPENTPSRRVAERNGLTLERTFHWRGYDHGLWAKSKQE
jgi:RimJ/RimL family protein N-acetyltransferase